MLGAQVWTLELGYPGSNLSSAISLLSDLRKMLKLVYSGGLTCTVWWGGKLSWGELRCSTSGASLCQAE